MASSRESSASPAFKVTALASSSATEAPAGEGSPLLRGQDGAVSHAPAFLGRKTERAAEAPAPEAAAPEGEEVKKPRRRRAPRTATRRGGRAGERAAPGGC